MIIYTVDVDVAGPSGYPEALVGGPEWSFSLSLITLLDSNSVQLPGIL